MHFWPFSKSKFNPKSDRVNFFAPASPIEVSALFTQCPGDKVQTWTGQLDPARKFKCTAAARVYYLTARIDVVKYSHSNQCNFWKARWIYSIFSYNKCNGVEFTEVTRRGPLKYFSTLFVIFLLSLSYRLLLSHVVLMSLLSYFFSQYFFLDFYSSVLFFNMFFYLNSDVFSLYFKRCANWHQLTHLSNKTRHSYINLLCIAGQTAGPNRLKFVVDTLRSDQGGGG